MDNFIAIAKTPFTIPPTIIEGDCFGEYASTVRSYLGIAVVLSCIMAFLFWIFGDDILKHQLISPIIQLLYFSNPNEVHIYKSTQTFVTDDTVIDALSL